MCGTIRRTLNRKKKTRKDTKIKFYKAVAAPAFTYESEIWTFTKKQGARIETAKMDFLRSVAGYRRTNQKRNFKIMEELNIFILNDEILNFRSQWKNHVLRMEDEDMKEFQRKF
jgi:hypothetical protein